MKALAMLGLLFFCVQSAAIEVKRDDYQIVIKDGEIQFALLVKESRRVKFPDGAEGIVVPVANNIFSIGVKREDCARGVGTVALFVDQQVAGLFAFGPQSSELDAAIVGEVCRLLGQPKVERGA
jgi:hypothetical protein